MVDKAISGAPTMEAGFGYVDIMRKVDPDCMGTVAQARLQEFDQVRQGMADNTTSYEYEVFGQSRASTSGISSTRQEDAKPSEAGTFTSDQKWSEPKGEGPETPTPD